MALCKMVFEHCLDEAEHICEIFSNTHKICKPSNSRWFFGGYRAFEFIKYFESIYPKYRFFSMQHRCCHAPSCSLARTHHSLSSTLFSVHSAHKAGNSNKLCRGLECRMEISTMWYTIFVYWCRLCAMDA